MKVKRTFLTFEGIQIKSEECFHRFAKSVEEIEEQTGIHCVEIVLKDISFCPWINVENCRETHMERLLVGLIERMDTKP